MGRWRRSYHRGVSGFLRALWAEPPPPDAPPRRRRDWALVVALVSLALLEGALRADLPWRIATVVVGVGLAPTLLWRRSRPLLMIVIAFGVTGLGSILVRGNFPQSYTAAAMLVLVYALTRWGSGRAMLLGAAVVAGKVGLVLTARAADAAEVVGGFAVLTAVWRPARHCATGPGARARSWNRSGCWSGSGWPATCTTRWPTTSRRWRSAPRPASPSAVPTRRPRPARCA